MPSSGRTAFSAARPPWPTRSGKPIGISTAMVAGASGAATTSAKRGTARTRTTPSAGAMNAATQPSRQPSTPASHSSAASIIAGRVARARFGRYAEKKGRIGMVIRPRRSVLYMPGSNARAIEKARALPVDAVILDLEDSIAPDGKEAARQQVSEAVLAGGFGGREIIIRINGLDTTWWIEDLNMVAKVKPDAVLVPKV